MFTTLDNDSGIFVTYPNNWENLDTGKDIIAVEFDFYTGQTGQPKDGLGMVVISTADCEIIMEIGWDKENNRIYIGCSDMDSSLLDDPEPDTWYHIMATYDTTTGQVKARLEDQEVVTGEANQGMFPKYFDYTSIMETEIGIDNIVVSAVDEDVLRINTIQNSMFKTKLYPNPAKDLIHIKADKK